jgi:hypothetical protein
MMNNRFGFLAEATKGAKAIRRLNSFIMGIGVGNAVGYFPKRGMR